MEGGEEREGVERRRRLEKEKKKIRSLGEVL
jgi:hypothetical protein